MVAGSPWAIDLKGGSIEMLKSGAAVTATLTVLLSLPPALLQVIVYDLRLVILG